MFADNYYYREYQRLLVELHRLIAAGQSQSLEAGEIRNLMEKAEARLSEDEIVRLNALSSDLSMLHDREIPDSDVVARVPANEVPALIETAYKMEKWDEFLELMRRGISHLWAPDQIAYVRSRAYEGLDELSPAVAFMDEAARRKPTNANYRALALRLLWDSERYEEAYLRARDYLKDASTKARLIFMSGGIVVQRAMQIPEPQDLDKVATSAVSRMRQALPSETSPNLIYSALVCLGVLALQIDDAVTAAAAFNDALRAETVSGHQVTSSSLLTRELELVQGGQAKSPAGRLNARLLVESVEPSRMALAA